MNPPNDYYPCFLGNGIDAVLIGPTGAMTQERAQGNLDRCYWYKADRYYPEGRVVPTPGRLPREGQPLYQEGADWKELAPLAHCWYEVRHDGLRLDVRSSEQRFNASMGELYSEVDYGAVKANVTTFLHANRPLLVIHCRFDKPVIVKACLGAAVWVEEGYDTNPFADVSFGDTTQINYQLDTIRGTMLLGLDARAHYEHDSNICWLETADPTQQITLFFSVRDDHDSPIDEGVFANPSYLSYNTLSNENTAFWEAYAAQADVEIHGEQLQTLYDYSLYQFKASQNRFSGGLPVNNLRLTWSSHVFWDAFYMHRTLIEANRKHEALEGARFFMRTLDHAKKHAQEFNAPGLKWDWEITHRGEHAYGTWLHQKEQMHNNASYANIIWQYYEFTQDHEYLAEFYPLLRGLAEFFLANVVEQTERGVEIRALVDVGEHVTPVKNEGFNLSGTIRILQLTGRAASILDTDADFAGQCNATADGLMKTLDGLYNGSFFDAAEGDHSVGFASLAPIYPMQVVDPKDPRAISTARAYLDSFERQAHGLSGPIYSAWGTGVLATILAMQGEGDAAWKLIESTKVAMCSFGGFSELVFAGGHWNMQYFSTAQAAVCTAIHNLLLQSRAGEILVFPAAPKVWQLVFYKRLLAHGFEVSANINRYQGVVAAEIQNVAGQAQETTLRYLTNTAQVKLEPGESARFEWQII